MTFNNEIAHGIYTNIRRCPYFRSHDADSCTSSSYSTPRWGAVYHVWLNFVFIYNKRHPSDAIVECVSSLSFSLMFPSLFSLSLPLSFSGWQFGTRPDRRCGTLNRALRYIYVVITTIVSLIYTESLRPCFKIARIYLYIRYINIDSRFDFFLFFF